jgi:3-deoxy-D-manno-octulosonic acid kinase
MNSFEFKCYGNKTVIFNKSLTNEFPLDLFSRKHIYSNPSYECKLHTSIDGQKRGSVHVFRFDEMSLVLRHYYRGGSVAKLVSDKYIWQGLNRSRALRELQILSKLQEQGLPVPTPIAAHVCKTGLVYSADLITQLIPKSYSLSSILIENAITKVNWENIGSVVKKFHNVNCNHIDLNAHNILLNEDNSVFLIDFDKSKIEEKSGFWRKENIKRLVRSLEKLKKTKTTFYYTDQDFDAFLEGYKRD